MKRLLVLISIAATAPLVAGLESEARAFIPAGWLLDNSSVVVADFDFDGGDDIALCYFQVDPELGEIENRINRILVLLSDEDGLYPVLDQGLPEGEDYGVELQLDWNAGILTIYQHRGIMHQWNQWQLMWDSQRQAFWERTSAWGGLMGLGSAGGFDAATGVGYVEKIWDDVDISAEYLTIYASRLSGTINIDGLDEEPDWERCRVTDTFWVNYGEKKWKGNQDAGLAVRALYDDARLYLFIDVSDDVHIPVSAEDDVLNLDHLELWFDLFNWEEADREGYFPELWNRKKDKYVCQLALAEDYEHNPIVMQWLPEGQPGYPAPISGIRAAFREVKGQWTAEISLDWENLGSSAGAMEYLTTSVVFSDSDDQQNPKQETLAGTSEVRWADPFTFGSLVTTEPKRVYWGVEPLLRED